MKLERPKYKMMGVYYLEILDCKCEIKNYFGGKTIFIKNKKCKQHENRVYFKCNKCGKEMLKKELKEHQWTHAIK